MHYKSARFHLLMRMPQYLDYTMGQLAALCDVDPKFPLIAGGIQ